MAKSSKLKTDESAVIMARLGGTIRFLREKAPMSVRDFAEKAGVGHSDVFRLENGSTRNPSILLIHKIAKAFDLSVDELMNFEAKTCPTCGGRGWIKEASSE